MINLDKNKYFVYNDSTIMEVDSSVLSFITLLPIRSVTMKDWKQTQAKVDENYEKDFIETLLKSLNTFEIDTFTEKGNYGTTYKLISFYEKETLLQRELMKDSSIHERLDSLTCDQKTYEGKDRFLKSKEELKAETISNYNFYEKSDFLVIKTFYRNDKVLKGEEVKSEDGEINKVEGLNVNKKETLLSHFRNYTKEKYKSDKSTLDNLYLEHQNKYLSIESNFKDNSFDLTSSNLMNWFSKISLSTGKTSVEDFNFIKNNILNGSPDDTISEYRIIPEKGTIASKIYEIHPEKIKIYVRKGNKYKTVKMNSGESVEIEDGEKEIKLWKTFYKNGVKRRSVLDKTTKSKEMYYESGEKKFISKGFLLTSSPPTITKDFSHKLSESIRKDITPDSYVIQLELFQLPQLQQKKVYDRQLSLMTGLSSVSSFGGFLYDRQTMLDKIQGLTGIRTQIGKTNYFSVRYSFGYKKNMEVPKDEKIINLLMKTMGSENYATTVKSLNKVLLPWSYTPYILKSQGRESSFLLSDKELSKMINFKDGEGNLSFSKPRRAIDVLPIKKSCFFVKTENEVQGVDIFKGPEKFNGLIIAPSGSGKSFFAVNMLDGFISANKNNTIWILDRGGSFERFTDSHEGVNKVLDLSSDKNSVNPFGLNINVILMLKLHFYEKFLNEVFYDKELGKKVKKNSLTKEIDAEIKNIVSLLKTISRNTSDTFNYVDSNDSLLAYNELPDNISNKLDTFKYIVKNGELESISTYFSISQIQDTFSVLSSIVLSMLNNKAKPEFVKTSFSSIVPKVIRKLFLNKMEDLLLKQHLITDYDRMTKEVKSEVEFDSIKISGYENPEEAEKGSKDKEVIYIKEEEDVIEYSNINIFFLIDELKEEMSRYIRNSELDKKDTLLGFLNEFDFYIDEVEAGKLFNVEPPKDLSNERLVNIDLGEAQDERLTSVIPSALLMNFFKILTAPSKRGTNKILLIDEAHAILGAADVEGLNAIAYLFRTARKHGGGIWLISQSVEDFYQPQDKERNRMLGALIKNAGWRVLLGSGHQNTQEALGFSGDSVDFANKSKDGKEKYKMIIDMDGKVTSVVDLVVSSTDYWNSTTHAAEKTVLDLYTLLLGSPQHGKMIASKVFNSSSGGMRETYPTLLALEEANPSPTDDEVLRISTEETGREYSPIEKSRLRKSHSTVYALISEAIKKQISLK